MVETHSTSSPSLTEKGKNPKKRPLKGKKVGFDKMTKKLVAKKVRKLLRRMVVLISNEIRILVILERKGILKYMI